MEQTNGNKVKNEEQDRRLAWLENHYSTFNTEMGDVKQGLALVRQDFRLMKDEFVLMKKTLENVDRALNKRPTWILATVFSVLFSALVGIAVYLLTN